jgi:hypothetical protein
VSGPSRVLPSAAIDTVKRLADGMSVMDAAAAARVSDRTVRRWLERDDFYALYQQALARRIRLLAPQAIQAIQDGLIDGSIWARLAAADRVHQRLDKIDGLDQQTGVVVSFQSTMPSPALPDQDIESAPLPDST